VLAERCGYFRTMFAESSAVAAEKVDLSFDFTTAEQVMSFHQLLTFLYIDSCPLLTDACASVCVNANNIPTKAGISQSKRKGNAKGTSGAVASSSVYVYDPVLTLKTMARKFDVPSLLKR